MHAYVDGMKALPIGSPYRGHSASECVLSDCFPLPLPSSPPTSHLSLSLFQDNFGANYCKDISPELVGMYKSLMLVRCCVHVEWG